MGMQRSKISVPEGFTELERLSNGDHLFLKGNISLVVNEDGTAILETTVRSAWIRVGPFKYPFDLDAFKERLTEITIYRQAVESIGVRAGYDVEKTKATLEEAWGIGKADPKLGFTDGPFPTIEDALEIVGAVGDIIYKFPDNEPYYRFHSGRGEWVPIHR